MIPPEQKLKVFNAIKTENNIPTQDALIMTI